MHEPKPPSKKVLPFAVPNVDVEEQLLIWIRAVVESNQEMITLLERLRISYRSIVAGAPVTNANALLWQVEVALSNAAKAKNAASSL
jgi:hypothetical protein